MLPMGFLHRSAEPSPTNPYVRTLMDVKRWGTARISILCVTQVSKTYKVNSPDFNGSLKKCTVLEVFAKL